MPDRLRDAKSASSPIVPIRKHVSRGWRPNASRRRCQQGVIPVVAGFQGINEQSDVTTFGRGGSDLTAVALAAALKADRCIIFTDVDGVYTADPNIVPAARRIDKISYEEMLEMASLGAKVLQSRSVEFAAKFMSRSR